MHYIRSVQTIKGPANLVHKVLCDFFIERPFGPKVVVKVTEFAKFKNKVEVFWGIDELYELNYVWVVEFIQNVDFPLKVDLAPLAEPLELIFRHHLDCVGQLLESLALKCTFVDNTKCT